VIKRNLIDVLFLGVLGLAQGVGALPEREFKEARIGPGDLLEIQVLESTEMSRQVKVSAFGTIQLPLLGEFLAVDLTTSQLGAKIASLLNDEYLQNPHVSVIVLESSSLKVNVLGAVGQAGTYPIDGATRLLDVLLKAGGIKSNSQGTATLIRKGQENTVVDVRSLLQGENLENNLVLQPGDLITVAGPAQIQVLIFGEVAQAGLFRVDDDMTLLRVISMAGGTSDRAAKGKVKIFREAEGGKIEEIKVDLNDILKGKHEDILLHDGDRILVPKTFF
jgi:polysaccharide export outer membrane protein